MLKEIRKRGAGVEGRPFLFLFLFSLFSCGGPPLNQPGASRIIPNVPFYPQEVYQCGPASLAGVLSYWGLRVSSGEIAAEIFSPQARGTLDMDMVFYAQKKGLQVDRYTGTWEDLKKNVESGHPLIVLVDEGFWVYEKSHFMVVVGYDGGSLIANSGSEEHKFIPRDHFLRTWERTRFWTLRITPK